MTNNLRCLHDTLTALKPESNERATRFVSWRICVAWALIMMLLLCFGVAHERLLDLSELELDEVELCQDALDLTEGADEPGVALCAPVPRAPRRRPSSSTSLSDQKVNEPARALPPSLIYLFSGDSSPPHRV